MSSDGTGHDLAPHTTGTKIERQQMTTAGQAANSAAAHYLFADYRQRRAESTLRTQRAALVTDLLSWGRLRTSNRPWR